MWDVMIFWAFGGDLQIFYFLCGCSKSSPCTCFKGYNVVAYFFKISIVVEIMSQCIIADPLSQHGPSESVKLLGILECSNALISMISKSSKRIVTLTCFFGVFFHSLANSSKNLLPKVRHSSPTRQLHQPELPYRPKNALTVRHSSPTPVKQHDAVKQPAARPQQVPQKRAVSATPKEVTRLVEGWWIWEICWLYLLPVTGSLAQVLPLTQKHTPSS